MKMISDGKWHKMLIYSSIDGRCNNDKWFANWNWSQSRQFGVLEG